MLRRAQQWFVHARSLPVPDRLSDPFRDLNNELHQKEVMQEFSSIVELLGMLLIDPRSGVLIALLVMAAISDYRTFRIPNWLTMGGALFALGYSVAVPFSPQAGFLWAFGGLVLGLLMLLPLYLLRAMGAGDVKLMAMAGAFLGLDHIFYAVIWTFIVGGIAALGYALFHRVLGRMLDNIRTDVQLLGVSALVGTRPQLQANAGNSVGRLPYGVSIAIGTIAYLVAKQLGFL